MSTPVVTSKWAGCFDCDFCRRKRLMGDEFSKKALERYRKEGGKLKCKACVHKAQEAERSASAAKHQSPSNSNLPDDTRKCAGTCQQTLASSAFNKNQWSKGKGKSRCRACVEKAIELEAAQQKASKDEAIEKARANVEKAKASKNPQAILKAESELTALEAQKVTGLKPVKMSGRGRGRGYGRARGSARRR